MTARFHVTKGERRPGQRRAKAEAQVLTLVWPAAGVPTEWVAPSRSHPETAYVIGVDDDQRFTCGCEGFRRRHDCEHVRAAGVKAHRAAVVAMGEAQASTQQARQRALN